MKGRKPVPTSLKVIAGNPGKRKPNEKEPAGGPFDPTPPIWLTPEAIAFWHHLVKLLAPMNVLTAADSIALACLATAMEEMRAAHVALQREGRTVETMQGGEKTSPHFTIFNNAQATVHRLLAEFGMTPAARSRVKALAGGAVDPMDSFLKRNKKAG